MALRALLLGNAIARKKADLEALRAKDADFQTREDTLAASIAEVETDEQRAEVTGMVDEFEKEKAAHEQEKARLSEEIGGMEAELDEIEKNTPTTPAERSAGSEPERRTDTMYRILNHTDFSGVRSLPMGQAAMDSLPVEQRAAITQRDDVKNFLSQVRGLMGQNRAASGAELAVPVVLLDLISENMFRYSKLMRRVRVRTITGEGRQTIGGIVPEAVWTEMCAALNQLDFSFNQITVDGYKVGGWVPVCNSLLRDTASDLALASWIVEMLSESIGMAKDAAILYGKGRAFKMPMGIVTRLAQESKPDDYPANAPAWVDLHQSNIKTISASLTGAAFWAALTEATGNTFTLYSRGDQFWAMSSRTYNLLKAKAITFTASGDVVANLFGTLPVINGNIEVLEFIPDGDIIGGYGDLYLWAQREGMVLGMDETGRTNRILDETLFFGKERADGEPIIPGAFVAINIAGSSVTTTRTFPGDTANDATLEALTVGALTLSPAFAAGTVTYTASAANSVASAAVTATPAQADAQIAITATASATTKNVINGGSAALAVGENVIRVTVKKGNATRAYTVTVTRAAS